ncbi:MAG: hypothetical protein US50_C0006G0011 [Candidatus Nomurabacteria bacterium GW2011_GWB1_37_5]|uniref:DUF1003 domain-containing protein n=1 Tax=Candidatus Nomurabacteria bacterium GW2011_GWB1_37_5 TaxID=1618742 RepID=A0A0G0GXN6_9BACT|nr:MAG: hypothetical protein US50_C0006G0011 [Candidatus Nomurabacteria bacterium GW2011_GWB1_37_5]
MKNTKFISTDEKAVRRKHSIQSFKAKANAKRTKSDKVADWLTTSFGTIFFLTFNIILFAGWIIINMGAISSINIFDPFPFGLLTMIVSLEAIFLAIIVLISQNRANKIEELREEIELYINTYAESEITKMIYLQTLLLKKNGIDVSGDIELQKMLENLESDKIESELKKQLQV